MNPPSAALPDVGPRETLQCLDLPAWVRLRPDTFLGSVSKTAELRWLTGWKADLEALGDSQNITCLPDRDVTRLRKHQQIPWSVEDAAVDVKVEDGESAVFTASDADVHAELLEAKPEFEEATPTPNGVKAIRKTVKDAAAARLLIEYCPAG